MTMKMMPPDEQEESILDTLTEDSLAQVLLYLDLGSAVVWTRRVSHKWQRRLTSSIPHVWQEFFQRQAFSSEDLPPSQDCNEVLNQCKYRKTLQQTLFGPCRTGKTLDSSSTCSASPTHDRPFPPCFHLPNRLLSFVPVIPDDVHAELWDDLYWDDPPPVNFHCDSFILTSTAVGGELLFLNPFSKTLSIYDSVLDNAIYSDEGMLEHAIREAGSLIAAQQQEQGSPASAKPSGVVHDEEERTPPTWDSPFTQQLTTDSTVHPEELELVATAIADRVQRNHYMHRTGNRRPPKHWLISLEDTVLDVDLMSYFWDQRRQPLRFDQDDDDGVEVEIDYVGIDAKVVLGRDGLPTKTTMLAVGRTMYSLPEQGQTLNCFEVIAWFRNHGSDDFLTKKQICRVRGVYQSVDVCATGRLYVQHGGDPNAGGGTREICVYPMIPYQESSKSLVDPSKFFPRPSFVLDCREPVSTLGVCATGNHVVVPTVAHNLLIWKVTQDSPVLEQTMSVPKMIQKAFASRPSTVYARVTETPVVAVHCPRAMSIATCGFCTLQSSRAHGSTLLLWHKIKDGLEEAEWRLHSIVSLPLASSRLPKVSYDGNRLIVFGQDHIGFIILVYRVFSTAEHLAARRNVGKQTPIGQEDSGGVFHLTSTPRVKFVNRIRHVALGGIEDFESLRMTCNERFIVVNTKTGNLLSGGSVPFQEGLLVIDLEDHQ